MNNLIDVQKELTEVNTTDNAPKPVEVTPERKAVIAAISDVYGICFHFSKEFLEGSTLKNKFESVEKHIKKIRANHENKLKMLDEKLAAAEKAYRQAVKKFENTSVEDFVPDMYDRDIAPLEDEYNRYLRLANNTRKFVQTMRHLGSGMFAKDKKYIPALIHAHTIYLTLKSIFSFVYNDSRVGAWDVETTERLNNALNTIKDNLNTVYGSMPVDSTIESIVEFLYPVAEHSSDKAATKSRIGKEESFKCIDDVCEKYGIEVVVPELKTSEDPAEQEAYKMEHDLLIKSNQLKALGELIKCKPARKLDGTFTDYPKTKSEAKEIAESCRMASLYLSDITMLMSEKFMAQLPFRRDSIKAVFVREVPLVVETLGYELTGDGLMKEKLLVADTLMSLCLVDQIPTMLLYV